MPAQNEEIHDLLEEGGHLSELVAPRRIVTRGGRVVAVEMAQMRLGEADDSGRRKPVEVEGKSFEVPLDTLIVAIGQRPDLSLFGDQDIALTDSGYLAVDTVTLETSLPGVHAGGDIIGGGPDSIVKACGDGRKIAEAIIAREGCHTTDTTSPRPAWPDFDSIDILKRRSRIEPRVDIPHRVFSGRGDFAEVIGTLEAEVAQREASRCLDCDLVCSTCESVCPNRAIVTYRTRPGILPIPALRPASDGDVDAEITPYVIDQGPQVAVLSDACNECGNCVTFCPTADRPWRDKPRLYLHREDFESESDNAFMFLVRGDMRGLQARFGGATHELFEVDGDLRYMSPPERLLLERETLVVRESEFLGGPPVDPSVKAERLGVMITLLRAFTDSMPEFPLAEANPEWLMVPKD